MAALILLLGWLGAEPLVVTDTVDVCELNVVYDGDGNETFRQFVFSEWSGERYDVLAWRITKTEPVTSGSTLLFWDDNRLRRVRFGEYRVWHSQYDREIEQRDILPSEHRRGLTPHHRKGR